MSAIPLASDPRIIDSAEGLPDWGAWGIEVQKIVLGEPPIGGEGTPLRVDEPLPVFSERFPNLTHLHLWQIEGIKTLPPLPAGLKCLDVRGCSDLRSLPELPGGLETLVLEECPQLILDAAKQTVKFAELSDLSVQGCISIAREWLDGVLESAPRLRWLNASNCSQLERITKWPSEVVDVRLNGCPKLKQLPEYWPVSLRRLKLRGATRINQLEDFDEVHEDLDYLDLVGTINLPVLPKLPERLRTLFLYGSGILMPPASEHGEGSEDNVAEKTREFFRDIELVGKGEVRRCKVLMLGNGSAGKTCLSLALYPEKDPGEEARKLGTTHGVRFDEWIIETEVEEKERKVTAHIWDFGGQEIYHNTHRLFMEIGAVFVVLWKPEQDGKRAEVDENGYQDDWRPLRYWIDFIKMACPHRPEILVVCSHRAERCEELAQKARTEIGDEDETGYKLFFVDSKTRSGEFEPFVEQLKKTIGKTIERQGVKVPAHWEIAQEMAEEWLRALQGQDRPSTENIYRTVDEFGDELRTYLERYLGETQLHQYARLKKARKTGTFELDTHRIRRVLGFLTNSGWLFWNPRLSEERVIVGQQWALNGIYAALERRKGFPVYKALISRRGRFTVTDLPEESWQNRPEAERRLLVSFMKLTGICFPLVSREESYWSEEVLVSIVHLRDFEALGFERSFSDAPGSEDATSPVEIKSHFLHRGHWNAILASLGGYYGTTAEYARDGFWLPANKNQQGALIRCEIDEQKGIGGVISIRVKGPEGGDFMRELEDLVEANLPADDGVRRHAPLTRQRVGVDRSPEKIKVFFSYTWNPKEPTDKPVDYEKPVDMVYDALASESSLELLRDKKVDYDGKMRLVSDFLDELKKSDKVLVFHSPKYWQSCYCMWEMWAVQKKFQNSPSEPKSCLLFVEAAPSVFGDADERNEMLRIWEARCKDDTFKVPTWMTSFNPPVTGRDKMWLCAQDVLDWIPALDDPNVRKIRWHEGAEVALIATIREFLLSTRPATAQT